MCGKGISGESRMTPLVQGLPVKQELSLSSSTEVGKTKQNHKNPSVLAHTYKPSALRQNGHVWIPGAHGAT